MPDISPTWPRFLVFDANVYLDLAKVPGNARVLRAIEVAVRKGEFRLVVPKPVHDAVQRKRDSAIIGHWQLRRSSLKSFRDHLRDLSSNPRVFDEVADDLARQIDARQAELPESVAAMDSLLAAGTIVELSPQHYENAAQRFLQSRAPAHPSADKRREHRAILNDCLIWAIVCEKATELPVELVSVDRDFTNPKQNEELHPDLQAELSGRIKFHTLDDFLKVHIKDQPRVVRLSIPAPEWTIYTTCPVCGSTAIDRSLTPRPSRYGGWTYQQMCPGHGGYVDTGEPYDE